MKHGPRSGFTILEVTISSTIFAAIMGAFVLALVATRKAQDDAEVVDLVSREALEVVETLRRELGRSGFENGFPLTYDADDVGADYQVFEHATPNGETERSDVVFRIPADADGDGWPDVENDGDVAWEDDPRAFVLRPNETGVNDLVQVAPDGQGATIGRHVESVTYSSPAETNFEIPLDCMRVEVVTASIAADGQVRRSQLSAVVKLHNGGLSP